MSERPGCKPPLEISRRTKALDLFHMCRPMSDCCSMRNIRGGLIHNESSNGVNSELMDRSAVQLLSSAHAKWRMVPLGAVGNLKICEVKSACSHAHMEPQL